MKHLFTIGICLVLLASNRFAKAQNCNAGTVSALKDTVCQGTSASLTDKGSSGNIQWQSSTADTFANIIGATDSSLRVAPFYQTTYFRVIVNNGSCSDTSSTLRVLVPIPLIASFTELQTGNSTITFNSDSSKGNIIRYKWYLGDGDTSNERNPVHIYAKDSTYYVCLSIYDSLGCSYTFCRYISTTQNSYYCSADFTFSYSGNTVYFNASSKINDSYQWDFGDGSYGNGSGTSHVYDSLGIYNVCLDAEFLPGDLCGSCHEVTVGINAVKPVSANDQTLIVYPNPCTACEIKGIQNPTDLLVTDLLGRVVPVSFIKQSNGYGLNFPFGGSGMYLVKNIRTGEVVKVVRE